MINCQYSNRIKSIGKLMLTGKTLTVRFGLVIIILTSGILAQDLGETTIFDDSIRRLARYDAIDDFKVRPWQLKLGGVQFCSLYLVSASGIIPDYPYRSKTLEFLTVAGLPIYWAYRRDVKIPVERRNQVAMHNDNYQSVYIKEYETSIRQLRIFNGLAGAGVFGLTFVVVKALF